MNLCRFTKHRQDNPIANPPPPPSPRVRISVVVRSLPLFDVLQGVLYKRRDTLRGRFAFRQKYAVLRFPPSSAGARARGSTSSSSSSPTPPPTLTLLKGRGKHETEKVVSLEVTQLLLSVFVFFSRHMMHSFGAHMYDMAGGVTAHTCTPRFAGGGYV